MTLLKRSSLLALQLLMVYLNSANFTRTRGLSWPEGRYGLPKPIDGCPKSTQFTWESGILYQDCENTDPKTSKSPSLNLAGFVNKDVQREFCIKDDTLDDDSRPPWPSGQYCIYQKGSSCPKGLDSGWVVWDDENDVSQEKSITRTNGSLPRGVYDHDTKIFYCCSTKGSKLRPIDLPVSSPFYLIAYSNARCQAVRGATVTREFIYYETEDGTIISKNDFGGAHPYKSTKSIYGHTIFYCYYTPKYCPPLADPANGHLFPSRCSHTNQNVLNDTCHVHCNKGFVPRNLSGTRLTCGDNGAWELRTLTDCIESHQQQSTPSSTSKQNTTVRPSTQMSSHVITNLPGNAHAPCTCQSVYEQQTFVCRIIAGSLCGGSFALGVLLMFCIGQCRKEKVKKTPTPACIPGKSLSLEELVNGRNTILPRTSSLENLMNARENGTSSVHYDRNPLYENTA